MRVKAKPVSEEMAHLCSLLASELLTWPEVTGKPMFGLRAFYRGATVFAMFPEKRSLEQPNAIWYKLNDNSARKEGEKWRFLELSGEQSIAKAIRVLETAHAQALSCP